MLNYLRYRYAKTKMAAYINGELPPKMRRFIARLIDEDPRLYAEYMRQRQTKQELERRLPAFGRPEQGQLDAMWDNIRTQLHADDTDEPTPTPPRPRYSLGYGLAIVLCALALLVPLTFDTGTARAAAVPQHPQLETSEFNTPSQDAPAAQPTLVAVVVNTEARATHTAAVDVQNTPAPRTPGQ